MLIKSNTLLDITAIILTYNEEKHIERCILSLKKLAKKIIIVDSYSDDKTIKIAQKYNVKIYKNKFLHQSQQVNWALSNIKFKTKWIFRIDADEYLTVDLKKNLINIFNKLNKNTSGIIVNRKVKFLNKEINFGGTSPHKTLRIWKTGHGRCENAFMDEQMIVKGKIIHIDGFLIDENLNPLSWWIKKHKRYAIREAINYYSKNREAIDYYSKSSDIINNQIIKNKALINKSLKQNLYYKFPIFIRPIILFFYIFFLRLGFFTGWQGWIYCILQTLWFRFLVDLNILKINKLIKNNKNHLTEDNILNIINNN